MEIKTMDVNATWQAIIAQKTFEDIQNSLNRILFRRAAMQMQIRDLTRDGCIFGNVVEEWRGKYGPYYRLHFYTDPKTGEKPKPRYIKSKQVNDIQNQIANHKKRAALLKRLNEIDKTLATAKQHAEMLHNFLERQEHFIRYEQANLL